MPRANLMIDLETLGTKANTCILSLGAVLFNAEELGPDTYIVPSLRAQVRNRAIDASTLCWWMKQGVEAKKVFEECEKSSLTTAGVASEFSCFIDKHVPNKKELNVWSNGAGFDVPIVEHLLESVGLPIPWLFWNIRCYRTLKTLFPIEAGIDKQLVKHNALEDAKFQARCVSKFLRENPSLDR